MPIFGTEYVLSNAAQAANIALANNDYIKGSFKEYATAAHLSYSSSNFPDRFKTGQIVYVSQSNQLFRISIVYDEINEINVLTTQSFQFPSSGSASIPSGTISGSTQISAFGYILSSQTSSFVLSSQTSSMSVLSSLTASFISSTFISASAAASGFGSGGGSVPSGTISGSTQITALGFVNSTQTSSMSVLSALTASFISDIFISASAVRSGFGTALFPSGLLSSSFQIATDISGAFTSLSSSFASRITTLEGAGGGNGIFTLTGSFYSTTNNIQITGSLSVGSGSFKSFEVNSDGFVVLGDMNKDLNTAPIGTVVYSGSSFYLIT